MSWIVLLRPRAELDLVAARDWYDQKRPGLSDEFLDEVAAVMCMLEQHPERERFYFRNFRRVIVRRFPYKIFYQAIGTRIVVFRVLHARQNHEPRIGKA